MLALRRLIFDTARATKGVGALQETLKWGQPSYLTAETKSGSTIRIDQVKSAANRYALYFHCQTDLVATFRELYPSELSYGGNRSILLDAGQQLPQTALRHCVALALTYHLNKRKGGRGDAYPASHRHRERSEAIHGSRNADLDCSSSLLLAMTEGQSASQATSAASSAASAGAVKSAPHWACNSPTISALGRARLNRKPWAS